MRPEDVEIRPGAQRDCDHVGLDLNEVKDARARGQYVSNDTVEGDFVIVVAERLRGEGQIRMTCRPHPDENIIVQVRLV